MEGQQLPLTVHSESQSSSNGPWHPLYGSVTRHGSPWNSTTHSRRRGFFPLSSPSQRKWTPGAHGIWLFQVSWLSNNPLILSPCYTQIYTGWKTRLQFIPSPEPRASGEVTREPLGGLWGWARWTEVLDLGVHWSFPAVPARGSSCAFWVWTKDVVHGGAEAS